MWSSMFGWFESGHNVNSISKYLEQCAMQIKVVG